MPLQNRVTPWGELVRSPARGRFTGNRGVLHSDQREIVRPRVPGNRRWIYCLLEFKGRRRQMMTPGRYTELFFLDEATALAAGHRPCAECQRPRFDAFREAWRSARAGSTLPAAGDVDSVLHAERVGTGRAKRLYQADLRDLPDGVIIRRANWGDGCFLICNGELLRWSAAGYFERRKRPQSARVDVVTPASVVSAVRAGYVPALHPTALA